MSEVRATLEPFNVGFWNFVFWRGVIFC